jgi:hypothetical protein
VTVEIADLDQLVPSTILNALSLDVTDRLVRDIADAARAEWIRLAGRELRTSRRDYLNGIQPVKMKGKGVAVITLLGELPNLIEEGMPQVDLHSTLLGPNVPVSPPGEYGKHLKIDPKTMATGYYRAIPFRHATPGTQGAVGQPMGRLYRSEDYGKGFVRKFKKLGKEVYGEAQKLTPTKGDPYGKVKYGGRLPSGMAPKLKSHHKTDIFAGMIREEKTYVKATQSQYTTFRTISTGSPGWVRPATTGKHYALKINDYVARMAPKALEAFVESIG